jgi:hypothetical protein
MNMADCENAILDAIEISEYEDRPLSAEDLITCASSIFNEKAKRIVVGVENGVYRSNARDYFSLSDEEFTSLNRVIIHPPKSLESCAEVIEDL